MLSAFSRAEIWSFYKPLVILKKRLWHKRFAVSFAKFLGTPFFIEHLRWLLLYLTVCFKLTIKSPERRQRRRSRVSVLNSEQYLCQLTHLLKNGCYSEFIFFVLTHIIAYTKKYLQSGWLRGVQYWPYLYSVFNICTLWLNKKKNTTFEFRSRKIELYSLKTNNS